jgi:hypothetical protein
LGSRAERPRIGITQRRPYWCASVRTFSPLSVDLAGRHRISAYDTAYVAVAQRRGWQLVGTDIRDLVSKGLAVTPDAADYP